MPTVALYYSYYQVYCEKNIENWLLFAIVSLLYLFPHWKNCKNKSCHLLWLEHFPLLLYHFVLAFRKICNKSVKVLISLGNTCNMGRLQRCQIYNTPCTIMSKCTIIWHGYIFSHKWFFLKMFKIFVVQMLKILIYFILNLVHKNMTVISSFF